MPQTLALIHTSQVFFKNERLIWDLIEEILPDVAVINILDDSLLPQCMAAQAITPAVTRRMCSYIVAAETAGADVVLSTCSSLNPIVDVARQLVSIPVIKIDDAHTEKAVREARRIGVLATVETTLKPTVALIQQKAAAERKDVIVRAALAEAAFEALVAGDRERHDDLVADAAVKMAEDVELLLFAQASMTRLASRVADETGKPVLTSPRLAIEHVRRVFDSIEDNPPQEPPARPESHQPDAADASQAGAVAVPPPSTPGQA